MDKQKLTKLLKERIDVLKNNKKNKSRVDELECLLALIDTGVLRHIT